MRCCTVVSKCVLFLRLPLCCFLLSSSVIFPGLCICFLWYFSHFPLFLCFFLQFVRLCLSCDHRSVIGQTNQLNWCCHVDQSDQSGDVFMFSCVCSTGTVLQADDRIRHAREVHLRSLPGMYACPPCRTSVRACSPFPPNYQLTV